jgi:hypothetical protein
VMGRRPALLVKEGAKKENDHGVERGSEVSGATEFGTPGTQLERLRPFLRVNGGWASFFIYDLRITIYELLRTGTILLEYSAGVARLAAKKAPTLDARRRFPMTTRFPHPDQTRGARAFFFRCCGVR